jgi:hypothetical protein
MTHDHDSEVFEDQSSTRFRDDDEGLDGAPVFTCLRAATGTDLASDEADRARRGADRRQHGPAASRRRTACSACILELDGETVTSRPAPGIGYLHTGIEKNMEFKHVVPGGHLRAPAWTT